MEDFKKIVRQVELTTELMQKMDEIHKPLQEEVMKFLNDIDWKFDFNHPNIHLCMSLTPEKYDELKNITGDSNIEDSGYSLWRFAGGFNLYIVKKFTNE